MGFTGKELFSLKGKVAIVTGGAGLIGTGFCGTLAGFGAKTVIADRNFEKAAQLAEKINNNTEDSAYPFELDINSTASVNEMLDFCMDRFGKIDILVNNAYPRNKNYGRKFEDICLEDWNENTSLNLGGYFLVAQKVSEVMKLQKSGKIVNMASIYGLVGPDFRIYEGTRMTMPAEYSVIKGGIINFTRYLATLLAQYNINVNSIAPGGIFDSQPESFVKNYCSRTPMGRMGTPSDLTGTLIYLVSDASNYVTGQNIAVDGGWTAW